jgi:hypothetical protein
MRSLPIVKLFFLVLLTVVPGVAQNRDSSSAPKRKFKHQVEFVSVYDKSKDQTAVVMPWHYVKWPSGLDVYKTGSARDRARYELGIQAAFAYPGRVIKSTPQTVQFEIRVRHPGKAFFKSTALPELIANVDHQQISLGPTLLVKTKTFVDVDDGEVSSEHLSAYFTYAGLLRLIEAKNLTMKVGEIEFAVEDHLLEAFRDLASRMLP